MYITREAIYLETEFKIHETTMVLQRTQARDSEPESSKSLLSEPSKKPSLFLVVMAMIMDQLHV
jgi:hypothetical protein